MANEEYGNEALATVYDKNEAVAILHTTGGGHWGEFGHQIHRYLKDLTICTSLDPSEQILILNREPRKTFESMGHLAAGLIQSLSYRGDLRLIGAGFATKYRYDIYLENEVIMLEARRGKDSKLIYEGPVRDFNPEREPDW